MVINDWELVNQDTRLPVEAGDVVLDFRGEPVVLAGGSPPRHLSSSGRIWVGDGAREYFPEVFGLTWKRKAHDAASLPHAIECA